MYVHFGFCCRHFVLIDVVVVVVCVQIFVSSEAAEMNINLDFSIACFLLLLLPPLPTILLISSLENWGSGHLSSRSL